MRVSLSYGCIQPRIKTHANTRHFTSYVHLYLPTCLLICLSAYLSALFVQGLRGALNDARIIEVHDKKTQV